MSVQILASVAFPYGPPDQSLAFKIWPFCLQYRATLLSVDGYIEFKLDDKLHESLYNLKWKSDLNGKLNGKLNGNLIEWKSGLNWKEIVNRLKE